MQYRDDARDVKFNLFEWLPLDKVLKGEPFREFERTDLEAVLDEALKLARTEIAPANEPGDRAGARLEAGQVRVPEAFHRAYAKVVEGGWIGATSSPEFGGMGLPECAGTGINEFIMGANTALSLTLLLGRGASHLIETFGSEQQRALFCEKMVTGVWGGTMCLTEPGAGSDLGDIKTKAAKQPDGTYHLTGEKIFITSGDQDLTENIVHAVLARTPEAPVGPRGLSLFVVPKRRVNADGTLGASNGVTVAGIEHKLGIHGSPTCSLVFGADEPCVGTLLGKERLGLPYMFQMMNAARYEVGLQGLAIASTAHQHALAYARERLQGRGEQDRDPHAPQVPILRHPDVRRMLLTQASLVQAMRALLFLTAWHLDMARITEGEERKSHQGLVEILTPLCKAWCSEGGVRVADLAMQCYGGYGYTTEFPAEQYLRDARIAPIYEGTNAIQALDLVGRKFKMHGGEPVKALLNRVAAAAGELAGDAVLGRSASKLSLALQEFRTATEEMRSHPRASTEVLLNAVPILDSLGHLVGAELLLEQAALASRRLAGIAKERGADLSTPEGAAALFEESQEGRFYQGKIQCAVFFCHRLLPAVHAHAMAIRSGDLSAVDGVF
jgi:alkylation response protein AidB-like acyl-CoA dehydrogenase